MPAARTGLRREGRFPARVTGYTDEGRAFQEETVIRDLTLHGALIYLNHSPRLQSELHVQMDTPDHEGNGTTEMRLRGYVVRLEPGPEKDQTAVGIVFTE
jgi:hypothetical protein